MTTIITRLRIKALNRTKQSIAALLCGCMLLGMWGCGAEEPVPTESTVSDDTYTSSEEAINRLQVVLDGQKYAYNDHLSNFLFLGIDQEELVETSIGSSDAGRSDALFLVSFDRVTGDTTVISIPRDCMTEVDLYDRDGEALGPSTMQIGMAYAYGDGKHKSCDFAKEAVSRLFYRIPIQGYCAVTMDALEQMSDILGPVTVTVPNDSLAGEYPEMQKGTEVEITSDNVEIFVRYRDIEQSHTAYYRLERQNAFIEACFHQVLNDFESHPELVSKLYDGVKAYMVTNMGNDQFVKMLEGLQDGGELTRWTVPGESVATESYDEFHVDKDALYEQLILSFFEEVK